MTSVVNLRLNYSQVLGLAMQLNFEEKIALTQELKRASALARLKEIKEAIGSDAVDEDEIRQECEIVRQEMYERRLANCR